MPAPLWVRCGRVARHVPRYVHRMKWFWAAAVEPLLEAVDARTIVEVGVLQGGTTAEAIAYAEGRPPRRPLKR
jgi:hypothetical protein